MAAAELAWRLIAYAVMGMELGAFALAAFSDDEWVAHQRHLLNLLWRYRRQVDSVRDTLEQNLALLRERETG